MPQRACPRLLEPVRPEKARRSNLLMVLHASANLIGVIRLLCFVGSLSTSSVRSRLSLQLEIAALRHQLSVYQSEQRRPSIHPADRLHWSLFSRCWSDWRRALYFVQPRTVVIWQNKRFRDYWRALSQQGHVGRLQIAQGLRQLIKRMWQANPVLFPPVEREPPAFWLRGFPPVILWGRWNRSARE